MISDGKRALVLFEGREDKYQFERLVKGFCSFLEKEGYDPVKLETSIYELYDPLIGEDGEPEYDSLASYLTYKGKVKCPMGVRPQDQYSLIYLIFDFDPCYHLYDETKIRRLQGYFQDETTNGRLYINYPMVEAIFDFYKNEIGEIAINQSCAISCCNSVPYKKHVTDCTCFRNPYDGHSYKYLPEKGFAIASLLTEKRYWEIMGQGRRSWDICDSKALLEKEIEASRNGFVYPLSAFPFMELDYNPDDAMERWGKLASDLITNH